jgi:hypothetical protein
MLSNNGQKSRHVEYGGQLHGIHCQINIYILFDLAASLYVGILIRDLGDRGIAIIIESINQGTQRSILVILMCSFKA